MSGKSQRTSKIAAGIIIFINIITMMTCLFVFVLSLWVIASPLSLINIVRNFGNPTMKALITEESLSLQLGIAGALLAGFFFCISFMGIYAAVTGSQFLLFMYATLLFLLLLLECSVTYYLTSNLVEKGIQMEDVHFNHVLRTTLKCCDQNYNVSVEVIPHWSCCGVDSYPNNCTIDKIYTLNCDIAITAWLGGYEVPFYISLVTLHVILLFCSLLRRYLSRPIT